MELIIIKIVGILAIGFMLAIIRGWRSKQRDNQALNKASETSELGDWSDTTTAIRDHPSQVLSVPNSGDWTDFFGVGGDGSVFRRDGVSANDYPYPYLSLDEWKARQPVLPLDAHPTVEAAAAWIELDHQTGLHSARLIHGKDVESELALAFPAADATTIKQAVRDAQSLAKSSPRGASPMDERFNFVTKHSREYPKYVLIRALVHSQHGGAFW